MVLALIRLLVGPSAQDRVLAFDALRGAHDDPAVSGIDAAITVQVVHAPVAVVVDEEIHGVAVHVARQCAAPGRVATRPVVRRRPEAADDADLMHGMAHRLERVDRQLELVEEERRQRDVLRPHVGLALGQEIAQPEMSGHEQVLVLRRHAHEARWRRVRRGGRATARLERPLADDVAADPAGPLLRERNQRDDAEVGHRADRTPHAHQDVPRAAGAGRVRERSVAADLAVAERHPGRQRIRDRKGVSAGDHDADVAALPAERGLAHEPADRGIEQERGGGRCVGGERIDRDGRDTGRGDARAERLGDGPRPPGAEHDHERGEAEVQPALGRGGQARPLQTGAAPAGAGTLLRILRVHRCDTFAVEGLPGPWHVACAWRCLESGPIAALRRNAAPTSDR